MTASTRRVVRLPWRVRWAAWQFARYRGEYYEYVAACLDVHVQHRSLLAFLQLDAKRHTGRSPRAILASWWAEQYLLSGANLQETLQGTLPASDIACLALAQSTGLDALLQMLRSLANQRTQLVKCQKHFLQTILAGVIAMLVALSSLLLLPGYSMSKLTQTFSMVSPQYFGSATLAMKAWVHWVGRWGWLLPVVLGFLVGLLRWSLENWNTALRDRWDAVWVWRLWRDLQAVEFLALTASLVQALGSRGVSLRTILQMQLDLGNRYRQVHLMRMLVAMDLGVDSIGAMNTGMIDQECWWRLQDMVHGYGLTSGFSQAGEKVLTLLVGRLGRQAWAWRIGLLAVAVATVLCVGYWHALIIEEMRQAMMLGVFLS